MRGELGSNEGGRATNGVLFSHSDWEACHMTSRAPAGSSPLSTTVARSSTAAATRPSRSPRAIWPWWRSQTVPRLLGVCGYSAATAAARQGASVLLVERYGFLGGLATHGLIRGWFPRFNLYPDCMGGIPMELLERMQARDAAERRGDEVELQ